MPFGPIGAGRRSARRSRRSTTSEYVAEGIRNVGANCRLSARDARSPSTTSGGWVRVLASREASSVATVVLPQPLRSETTPMTTPRRRGAAATLASSRATWPLSRHAARARASRPSAGHRPVRAAPSAWPSRCVGGTCSSAGGAGGPANAGGGGTGAAGGGAGGGAGTAGAAAGHTGAAASWWRRAGRRSPPAVCRRVRIAPCQTAAPRSVSSPGMGSPPRGTSVHVAVGSTRQAPTTSGTSSSTARSSGIESVVRPSGYSTVTTMPDRRLSSPVWRGAGAGEASDMSDSFYSVTVVGRHRRLDVSLPADVPVSELIGELVPMLEEPVDGTPPSWGLVRVGGEVLDGELGLTAQGVNAGGLLFLRDLARPVPPPAVDDYAGAVAAAIEAAPGLWTPARFQGLFVAAGVLLLLVLGGISLALVARGVTAAAPLVLLAASVVIVTGAIETRALGARQVLGALTAGVAVTLAAACVVLAREPGGWARAIAVAAALAALLQARRGRLTVEVVPLVLVGLATLATFELPYAVEACSRPDQTDGPAGLVGPAAGLAVLGLLGRHRRLPVGIRRQLGRAEALAAMSTVPLALGLLGLYA